MAQAGRTLSDNHASERFARGAGGAATCKTLIIIAGPTASGKSALALALAQRLGGTIINADAMQCYRELKVLTARPVKEDEALAPHALYGVRQAALPVNAAWWREAALAELAACKMPILCGGTGMYLSALLNGIAEIPDPGPAARVEARRLLSTLGAPGLYARLLEVDAATAEKLRPEDSQRIARAYEVWRGTGKGLAHWQAQPVAGLTGWNTRMILLEPPRDALKQAIAERFAAMLNNGAVEEVQALLALALDPAAPLLRAHGVPELAAYLRNEITLEEAEQRAVRATHQYTKRQATWFRHQKLVEDAAMQTIHTRIGHFTQLSESFMGGLANFINGLG